MGGIIRTAHLAKNTSRLKDLIIEVLSTNYPLTARKIHQQIISSHSVSVSYQRIHKLVRELVEYGVLKELQREYLINTEWLDQIVDMGQRIKRLYLNRPGVMLDRRMQSEVFDNSYSLVEEYKKMLASKIESETMNLPFLNAVPITLSSFNVREHAGKRVNAVHKLLQSKNALLLGDPGSGKTTTLKMIALQAAKENKQIPIICRLSSYQGESLPTLVNQAIRDVTGQKISEHLITALLHEGSFKILFDGLNEATGKVRVKKTVHDRKELALNKINRFMQDEEYSKNSFIISCRTYNDPKDRLLVETFNLQPLTNKMIELFLSQNNAISLYSELRKNNKLLSLCRNPFVLSMLLKCHWRGRLRRKADIYKLFIDEFFYTWESRHIKSNKEAVVSDMLNIISALAYEMSSHGTSMEYMQAHRVMEATAKNLRLKKDYFNELLKHIMHANIIRKTGNECMFMHQSLQEYFTAIAMQKKGAEAFDGRIKDKQWHDTLIFYASIADDAEVLIKKIIEVFTDTRDYTYLFLAAKCASEINMKSTESFDALMNSLLKIYNYHDDEFYLYWYELNNIFQSWRNKNVTKRILRFFEQTTGEISPRIVNVLHHSDDALQSKHGGIKKLQEVINSKNENKHLLYSAVEIMALTKNVEIIPSLIKFLSSRDPILKTQSAWALKEIGEEAIEKVRKKKKVADPEKFLSTIQKNSFKTLIKLLANKGNEDFIRGHAIIELCKADYKKAIPYIIACLEENKPIMRYHAMYMVPNMADEDASFLLNYIQGKEEVPEEYKKIVFSIKKQHLEVPKNGR